MRGEHASPTVQPDLMTGSSPLARGAHGREPVALLGGGIIPACAGSTTETHLGMDGNEDHPRLRGEHFVPTGKNFATVGSSPLARGAHFDTSHFNSTRQMAHSLSH